MDIRRITAAIAAICIAAGTAVPASYTRTAQETVITASAAEDAEYTEVTYGEITYHVYKDYAEVVKCGELAGDIVAIPEKVNRVPVTEIADYAFRDCSSVGAIDMPVTVNRIGEGAFSGCLNLSGVEISPEVEVISKGMFRDCRSLEDVIVPGGIRIIEDEAFMNCCGLRRITIPETAESIGRSAFENCFSLKDVIFSGTEPETGEDAFSCCFALSEADTEVTTDGMTFMVNSEYAVLVKCPEDAEGMVSIPAEAGGVPVRYIGKEAFSGCNRINGAEIPDTVRYIGDSAFSASGLSAVVIPDSVVAVGDSVFMKCRRLKEVLLPAGLRVIGPRMFAECESLSYVGMPEGIREIGDMAFFNCAWIRLRLPESVVYTGRDAFTGTEWIDVIRNADGYSVANDILIDAYGKNGLKDAVLPDGIRIIAPNAFGSGTVDSVTVPDSVELIYDGAFTGDNGLKRASLPVGVQTVGDPFRDCVQLTDIYFAGTEVQWDDTGISRFYPSEQVSVTFEAERHITAEDTSSEYTDGIVTYTLYSDHAEVSDCITDARGVIKIPRKVLGKPVTAVATGAFSGCDSITGVKLPEGLSTIGEEAFFICRSLSYVELPDSLLKIDDYAFAECTSLTGISLPDSLTSVGDGAFARAGLTEIKIPGSIPADGFGLSVFSDCESLTAAELPEGFEVVPGSIFSGCTSLSSVTIPESVKKICWGAFKGCSSLEAIDIPDSVVSIEYAAFEECTALMEIILPESMERIESCAFADCKALERCIMPKKVKICEHSIFTGCESLTEVSLPENIGSIESNMFAGCVSLRTITFPDGTYWLGGGAFKGCTGLEEAFIPGSVTRIEDDTFEGCTSLADVWFGGTEEQWEEMKKKSNATEDSELVGSAKVHFLSAAPAEVIYGDANLDGKITVSDAVAVLQYITNAGKYPLSDTALTNADCDGSIGITGDDAVAIQKFDAGLTDRFPAEGK